MKKSKIEWTDYSINPVKGLCPMACSYCYARRMYKRFKWDETVRYVTGWEDELDKIKKPSRIFVGSTMELFVDWIMPVWIQDILQIAGANPQHTFIFLTKQPQNLIKRSPFPDNCWVGVSATNEFDFMRHFNALASVKATVKFWSFEPLLRWWGCQGFPELLKQSSQWVIIGQQTPVKKSTQPKIEWIKEIVEACDKSKIPVFLKNNLLPLLAYTEDWAFNEYITENDVTEDQIVHHILHQEFPVLAEGIGK